VSDAQLQNLRAKAEHWLACNRPDHAEAVLREMLALAPTDAFAMTHLSTLLADRNDLAEARSLAASAIREHPEDPRGFTSLSRAAGQQRDHAAAIDAARQAIRLRPHDAYPHGLLATALLSARQVPEARDAALACLRLQPWDFNGLAIIALTSLTMGDYVAAEHAARALLQIGPVEGFCLTTAARVFCQIGRRAEGMRFLRTLIQREPNNARAHEAIGLACWDRGDIPTARRHFREALRLDPRMERVRQILRLHARTKPQDMPEGWVYVRYLDRVDAHGNRRRFILEERRRPTS
jgi:tetratricopeptide (TPR) repeat protein